MYGLTILSLLVLGGFIAWSIALWGIPESYSALAAKWTERCPINHFHVWSLVTIAAALFIVPPMIDVATGDPLQCLGFFAPLYLVAVGCTPTWESSRREHVIHSVAAGICAACALAWMLFVLGLVVVVVICAAGATIAAVNTRTLGRCVTFWLEVVMFVSVYVSLLITL